MQTVVLAKARVEMTDMAVRCEMDTSIITTE